MNAKQRYNNRRTAARHYGVANVSSTSELVSRTAGRLYVDGQYFGEVLDLRLDQKDGATGTIEPDTPPVES